MATKEKAEVKDLVPVLVKQTAPFIKLLDSFEVKDEKTKSEAATMLNDLKAVLDRVTKYKELKTKPLNQALKVIRDETRELEGDLKTAIDATRAKLSTYQTEQLRIARIEEDKIAARVKEGRGNLTPETATKKIAELDKPAQSVSTGAGEVKFRTVRKLVIDDLEAVKAYTIRTGDWSIWNLDEAELKPLLLSGKEVDGAHIDEVQEAASYRS